MTHSKSGSLVVTSSDYNLLPFAERQFRRLPVVDRETGSISITRCLAVYFAYLDGLAIQAHGITWAAFWLAIACLATAFGKSTFGFFLTKLQMTQANTSSESVAVSYAATEIIDRRNVGQGLEHTP